jgi:histidine triad (HIT) family protein
MADDCRFCEIVSGQVSAHTVLEEQDVVAFLDARPVFPGHVLVMPRAHHVTLTELPTDLVQPMFLTVQRLAFAVEEGMDAHGTFVAINNTVSQSVPHLHVHVVPRRFKDGLRGFFWPRQRYQSEAQKAETAARIRDAIRRAP